MDSYKTNIKVTLCSSNIGASLKRIFFNTYYVYIYICVCVCVFCEGCIKLSLSRVALSSDRQTKNQNDFNNSRTICPMDTMS